MTKIYVASSWKNVMYETTRDLLRIFNFDVLDWREGGGFRWTQVSDIPVEQWSPEHYRDDILTHARAEEGFANDYDKMKEADVCVLLLPCGRSAHLEAGWFWGQNKPVHIYIPVFDTPELMYKGATSISFNIEDLVHKLMGTTK